LSANFSAGNAEEEGAVSSTEEAEMEGGEEVEVVEADHLGRSSGSALATAASRDEASPLGHVTSWRDPSACTVALVRKKK
jgi:hypothetical protein